MSGCSTSKKASEQVKQQQDSLLNNLFSRYPQFFDSIIKNKEELNVQIIYTQIDRDKKNHPTFTDHYFNVNKNNYFYPASTVKFPVAVLALQRLNELKIKSLDKYSTMITEADGDGQTAVYNDPTTPNGQATIAHYVKKILLVSDNDAFNRLYEFLGQEYINNSLHKMGYDDVQIIHRLEISLNEQQNRQTNPIKFIDPGSTIIYEQPTVNSKLKYTNRNTKMGRGYMKGDKLVNEPFDFSIKNRLSLQDLHQILRAVIFPAETSVEKRFNLMQDEYTFLYKYMSMYPGESKFPYYDSTHYYDNYVKFLLYGAEPVKPDAGLRIFNKVGDAYGFLIDAAYIVDFKNKVEFLLTATIHCNKDGIINDNKYDYDTIGFPFLKNLGKVIYGYELKRVKTNVPDLSSFRFNYSGE
jgi:hypothetical protein